MLDSELHQFFSAPYSLHLTQVGQDGLELDLSHTPGKLGSDKI